MAEDRHGVRAGKLGAFQPPPHVFHPPWLVPDGAVTMTLLHMCRVITLLVYKYGRLPTAE